MCLWTQISPSSTLSMCMWKRKVEIENSVSYYMEKMEKEKKFFSYQY